MWNLRVFLFLVLIHTSASTALRPHILYIMADDIGYNDAGFRGSQIPTPNIDRLANAGVILDFHYVMPQCSPTRAAFMTGKDSIRTGSWYGNMKPGQIGGLDLGEKTVAEMLKEHQYKSHLVGKWHLGMSSPDLTPVSRGFDSFLGMYLGSGDYFKHKNGKGFDFRFNYRQESGVIVDRILRTYDTIHSTDIYTNRTIDLLEQHVDQYGTGSDEPLFIFLSYQAPHGPYQVPNKYVHNLPDHFQGRSGDVQKYAGMVVCMDEGIGRIHSRLTELNMIENTLIVFTSDNGAIMDGPGSNFPLRGGKKTYYEGGIRALAWVNSPLLQTTGYVNKNLHHITDWYPTFEYLATGSTSSPVGSKRKSKRKKFDKSIPHVDGVNIWDSISEGSSCRETVLINIQRTDMYNSDGSDQREKLIVNTPEKDGGEDERGETEDEVGGRNQGNHVHVARPEDGTEIIDEDPEEDGLAGETDQETDDLNITEDSGGSDGNGTITETEEGNRAKRKIPFKDLVVYIWKSWKIIIGNEKSFYAGWKLRNGVTLNTEEYKNDTLDDTDNTVYLYELNTDPKEKRNIARKYPGMVKEMINRINKNHWDMVKPMSRLKYSQRGLSAQRSIWRPWILSRSGDVMTRVFEDNDVSTKSNSNTLNFKITDSHRFGDSDTDNLSDTEIITDADTETDTDTDGITDTASNET